VTIEFHQPAGAFARAGSGHFEFSRLLDVRVVALLVAVLLLLRIPFALLVPPNGDEAFYWLWGQHPQWSYRDHGPLVGWFSGLGNLLFGWSVFGLRFPTLISTAATLLVFWAWAGRLAPHDRIGYFWTVSAIYLCSPLMQIVAANVYPDHVLVPLLLLALYLVSDFLLAWREGGRSFTNLYLGAVALGLAGLAKYNAVFVGLALVGAILADPRLRGLLRAPQLYLAGALCLLVVSPVILWNWVYDFPTLRLHAAERYRGAAATLGFSGVIAIATSLVALGPTLLWQLYRFLLGRRSNGILAELRQLGGWCFVLSTGFMLALTSWNAGAREFDIHWNVVAYLPFIVAAPLFFRRRWQLVAHFVIGGFVSVALALLTLLTPLPEQALGTRPRDVHRYGMNVVADEIGRQQQQHASDFVAAGDWATASRIAFAMGQGTSVTSISNDTDQFDMWFPGHQMAGKTAIFAHRGARPENAPQLPFDNVEYLSSVSSERFGVPLVEYSLYLGTGYKPHASDFDAEVAQLAPPE
jgi:hypothetical protein